MVDSVYCSAELLLFDILLLYHYINIRSLVIFWLFSGDIYFSTGISVSNITVSELFGGEILQMFVILSAILLPVQSPISPGVLWIAFFQVVLRASVADYLA